ncbi:MAG: hypothetical protein DRQ89_12555 [Epsilonproteobacteria bacterium]|nr:MAG: hypothetical protein DRQ89_12555 [Campylobacterota bacterium]
MINEIELSNSVVERTEELIKSLKHQIEFRNCTDGVTFSIGVNHALKHALKEVRDLIADSGLDGRFRKGRRRDE